MNYPIYMAALIALLVLFLIWGIVGAARYFIANIRCRRLIRKICIACTSVTGSNESLEDCRELYRLASIRAIDINKLSGTKDLQNMALLGHRLHILSLKKTWPNVLTEFKEQNNDSELSEGLVELEKFLRSEVNQLEEEARNFKKEFHL
jgi:hypothetical protein